MSDIDVPATSATAATPAAAPPVEAPFVPPRLRWLRKHPTLIIGALLLIAVAALSIAAPWIATHDPQDIDPLARMQLTEAALSFLGVGVPSQTPSWGNMMAEGRNFVAVAFHIILYPGLLLAATVLAINLLGDGLRDALDPRLARQL